MRMDAMNQHFIDRGFSVERIHGMVDGKSVYKFTITKDDHSITRSFEYPNCSVAVKNIKQEEFLRDTLQVFETLYPERKTLTQGIIDGMISPNTELTKKIKSVANSIYGCDHQCRDDAMAAFADSISLAKTDEFIKYCENDVKVTKEMWAKMNPWLNTNIKIKNVIFNDPATIVFWTDGTKTVVKAQDGDVFDPEKGLALAITKKALGNKGNYCNELKKWLPKEEEKEEPVFDIKLSDGYSLAEAVKNMNKSFNTFKRRVQSDPVQKAYDILVAYRDAVSPTNQISPDRDVMPDLDEVIGYLGEALED